MIARLIAKELAGGVRSLKDVVTGRQSGLGGSRERSRVDGCPLERGQALDEEKAVYKVGQVCGGDRAPVGDRGVLAHE